MSTPAKSKTGTGANHAPAAVAHNTANVTSAEVKLLKYVTTNVRPIVASLQAQSARYGELQRWTDMQTYLGIANGISTMCGNLTGFTWGGESPPGTGETARAAAAGT